MLFFLLTHIKGLLTLDDGLRTTSRTEIAVF